MKTAFLQDKESQGIQGIPGYKGNPRGTRRDPYISTILHKISTQNPKHTLMRNNNQITDLPFHLQNHRPQSIREIMVRLPARVPMVVGIPFAGTDFLWPAREDFLRRQAVAVAWVELD